MAQNEDREEEEVEKCSKQIEWQTSRHEWKPNHKNIQILTQNKISEDRNIVVNIPTHKTRGKENYRLITLLNLPYKNHANNKPQPEITCRKKYQMTEIALDWESQQLAKY